MEEGRPSACYVGTPNRQQSASMQADCVAKWMVRMTEPESCVSYFAGVAAPSCSAADLLDACTITSTRFTKRDAQMLCTNLQDAHQAFWPGFWQR